MLSSREIFSMRCTLTYPRAAGHSRKTTLAEWLSSEIIFGRDTPLSIELTHRSMDQSMSEMGAKMKTSAL